MSSSDITSTNVDGKEVFQVGNATSSTALSTATPIGAPQPPAPVVLEVDDLTAPVAVGTPCWRKGCTTTFVSDEVNRQGDDEGTVCHYHPLPVSTIKC